MIEIKPEHRVKLAELAARRGERGFSPLIADALEAYFKAHKDEARLRRRALRAQGSLSADDAERLRHYVKQMRSKWR